MTSPVQNIIADISNTALRYWLRSRNLPHSFSSTDSLIGLIDKLMAGNKLSLEDLRTGVREIEEHGGKRVYLREIYDPDLLTNRRKFEKHLEEKIDTTLSDAPTASIKNPSKWKVNYAFWSEKEIRVKVSERHIKVKFDKRKRQYEDTPITRFIVYSAEPETGFLTIFIDPPGDDHPHESANGVITDAAYTQFFLGLGAKIFGEFDNYKVNTAVEQLFKIEPPIYEAIHDTGWTEDSYRYSFRGRKDVRGCAARRAGSRGNIGPGEADFIRGSWLAETSEEHLARDLYMPIWPEESRIQFKADVLKKEVEYAISTIRDLQEDKRGGGKSAV